MTTALVHKYSLYGLQTVAHLHELHRMAQSYMRGWMDATGDGFPDYTDVRDYLMIHAWDIPYEWACQVALYITGPTCGRVALLLDDEPAYAQPFRPIL